MNVIHSHAAVVFEAFLTSNISVKHCYINAEDQLYTTLMFTQICVELLLKHTFCLCVYTHCQTHVLMAPDIQIFSFLLGAIEVSWQFTVCSACLLFIALIFHMLFII